MTHDYKRNGTTTLFAALDVLTGKVIGQCLPRHRAKEFLRFLKKVDQVVPKNLDVHAICDNYRTHKTKSVQSWLARHKRFKLHFTPTSSSWLNLVERLFAEITRQRIRRGVFKSVADLVDTIEAWIVDRNKNENELRVFVPRSRRKSSVGRRGRGALLGAGRIWKFQAGGSDVEAGGAGEMV